MIKRNIEAMVDTEDGGYFKKPFSDILLVKELNKEYSQILKSHSFIPINPLKTGYGGKELDKAIYAWVASVLNEFIKEGEYILRMSVITTFTAFANYTLQKKSRIYNPNDKFFTPFRMEPIFHNNFKKLLGEYGILTERLMNMPKEIIDAESIVKYRRGNISIYAKGIKPVYKKTSGRKPGNMWEKKEAQSPPTVEPPSTVESPLIVEPVPDDSTYVPKEIIISQYPGLDKVSPKVREVILKRTKR